MNARIIFGFVLSSTLVAGLAYAQEGPPSGVLGLAAPGADGPPPEPGFEGPLASWGEALDNAGIDFGLTYLNIYQNAPNFGFNGGSSANFGALIADVTWHATPDLRFNIAETFNEPSFNEDAYMFEISNAFFPLPVVDSKTDLTRLSFELDLFDDKLTLEAGRLPFALDFMQGQFCSGFGCVNSTKAINLNMPGETLSSWAFQTRYRHTPETTFNFAIAEDNPTNWQNGNGWNFDSSTRDGIFLLANVFHEENPVSTPMPLRYELGIAHSTSPYEDALYNSGFGNPGFPVAPTVVTHEGQTTLYGQARKTVWKEDPTSPFGKSLAAYGGVFHTFGDGVSYPWEAYAGLEYSGFMPNNPLFTVGTSLRYIQLSEDRAQYEQNARRFISGNDEVQPRDQFMFDLHAATPIGKNAFLEATAAYVVNPNTTVLADFSDARPKNNWVFGLNLVWDIGGATGLSRRRTP